uniref:PDZ domain-containing protein n=1 Tax=Strombidinopsis acuminata TaxID=141414 RepID=A0A7S3X8V0_9SPIT
MPAEAAVSIDVYPRVVKLYHGKKFKLGLDFEDVPGVGVVVSKVHPGYPAYASGLISPGDKVAAVNGTTPRDVAHTLDICLCRGGRGTDEYVLFDLSENQHEALKARMLELQEKVEEKPEPSPGIVQKVVRTLSFKSRRRSSSSQASRSSQQSKFWAD